MLMPCKNNFGTRSSGSSSIKAAENVCVKNTTENSRHKETRWWHKDAATAVSKKKLLFRKTRTANMVCVAKNSKRG